MPQHMSQKKNIIKRYLSKEGLNIFSGMKMPFYGQNLEYAYQ